MIFLIFSLLFIYALFFKQSKIVAISSFIFAWILSINTSLGDYATYEKYYLYNYSDFRDIGYYFLSSFFQTIGLNFLQFKMVVLAAGFTILCRFVIKYSVNCAFVSLIYLLFYSFYDIEQFRNFIAFCLVVQGLDFLLQNPLKIQSKIIYLCFVVLGGSLHVTVLFFMAFALIDESIFLSIKNLILKMILPLILIFYIVLSNMDNVFTRIEMYGTHISAFSESILILMYALSIIYVWSYDWKKTIIPYEHNIITYTCNKNHFILIANFVFLLTLPLAVQNLNYLRLFKYMSLLNLIFISNKNIYPSKTCTVALQDAILFIYGGCILGMYYFMHPSFLPKVIQPILFDNLILKGW